MKHPALLVLAIVLLAGFGFLAWRVFSAKDAPPPLPNAGAGGATESEGEARQAELARGDAPLGEPIRSAVAASEAALETLHPSVREALCGFTGRLVSPDAIPVANSRVELFRFAPDVLFQAGASPFVGEGLAAGLGEPQIDAGEAKSGDDGRFTIEGVYPLSTYLLHADIDGDAATWVPIDRAAGPGQLVDLGDIVLNPAGVFEGVVVGPDDRPVPGALVRAVDLPGSVLALVPFERFDPKGAVIVFEGQRLVIEMPAWVERRFEDLPLAQTRTDGDGRFRLRGVVPGGNLFAVTAAGLLPHVKPRLNVRSGEVKDLGTIRMAEGEQAVGRVEDESGKPVEGAELLVAARSNAAPVHFASRAARSDAEGQFAMGGMPPGEVIVAARRNRGEAWVVTDPQPVARDVIVKLPASLTLTVHVFDEAKRPVAEPRLQLLPGADRDAAIGMAMWGLNAPLPLTGRLRRGEAGEWLIADLPKGKYVLLADSPLHAADAIEFGIEEDRSVELVLMPKQGFEVSVLRPDGAPAAGAELFVHARGNGVPDAPMNAGRVDDEGKRLVDSVRATEVALSARHPAFGLCHLRTPLPPTAPIVLRFDSPGAIEGSVTEGGTPPARGKYMVYAVDWGGNRGALPPMPQITGLDAEGRFRYPALAPGQYRVGLVNSIAALRSPGGMVGYVRDAMFASDLPNANVQLGAGKVETVVLDTKAQETFEGPTVRLSGTVLVDGRLAKDHTVTVWGSGKRQRRTIDAAGRFEFVQVPVGRVTLQINEPLPEDLFASRQNAEELWRGGFELKEGTDLDLPLDLSTGTVEGIVRGPDGAFVADAEIQADGVFTAVEGRPSGSLSRRTRSDARGRFRFERLPVADWRIRGEKDGVGRSGDLQTSSTAGGVAAGLELVLAATHRVRGRLDMAAFGEPAVRQVYLWVSDVEGRGRNGWASVSADGEFELSDLSDGRYRVQINVRRVDDQWQQYHGADEFEVLGRDLEGHAIRPVKDAPPEARRG